MQEGAAFVEIDLGDRLGGVRDQAFSEVVATDLLQVAITQIEPPLGVAKFGERLPVPAFLLLLGKILLNGVVNLRF